MSLPIAEALPRVVDALIEAGLKERIRVIAAGKLVTSARAAWALCVGADFVNTARGFMFALGCIQALRCHTEHLSDRRDDAQQAPAARSGGRGKIPARRQLRAAT